MKILAVRLYARGYDWENGHRNSEDFRRRCECFLEEWRWLPERRRVLLDDAQELVSDGAHFHEHGVAKAEVTDSRWRWRSYWRKGVSVAYCYRCVAIFTIR